MTGFIVEKAFDSENPQVSVIILYMMFTRSHMSDCRVINASTQHHPRRRLVLFLLDDIRILADFPLTLRMEPGAI